MSELSVAAVGILVVLLTILWLKLHPLIGLLLGSLFVLAATPQAIALRNELGSETLTVVQLASGGLVGTSGIVESSEFYRLSDVVSGSDLASLPRLSLVPANTSQLLTAMQQGELSRGAAGWYSTGQSNLTLTKGLKLVAVSEVEQVQRRRWTRLGPKLSDGFANTFRKLGIPVTMAAIVGVCLLESGAAARLVGAIVSLFGAVGTAPALTLSGFLLGIPVFFDNVFYLLLPLAKAVGRENSQKYLAAVMSIIVGATMAHSLVPPTPGPLLVASAMNVELGAMMLGGMAVGSLAAAVGFAYGQFCARWIVLKNVDKTGPDETKAESRSRPMPLWLAGLPIAFPVLMLGLPEVFKFVGTLRGPQSRLAIWSEQANQWLQLFNDPGLVFILTAIMSIAILRSYTSASTVTKSVSRGIADAGTIVLLTCAGGAFGASLQQLQLADVIAERFSYLATPWSVLFTAFFVTTIIRAAQGSATVAMITSVAIVAPVAQSIELPFHPVYIALAIGCGSKPLPWMNDSGFWQVSTMTGLSVSQTLQSFSVALTLMGLTGFTVTLIGAWMFPFV